MSELTNLIQPDLRNQLYLKAMKNRIPLSGSFELTPRCNFHCKMCYIRMSENEMTSIGREYTADEWIKLGRICRDKGMLFLVLTGGEPFIRSDFKKIYTELCKMGLIISINSNGVLITEEMVEWLKMLPPSKIRITLYGGSNETYDRICGVPEGFDKVKKSVDMLLDAGISVSLNASFTPYNVCDLEAIYEFAKKRNLKVKPTAYMFPPLRRPDELNDSNVKRFSSKEAGEAMFNAKLIEMGEDALYWHAKKVQAGIGSVMQDSCFVAEEENMGCVAGKCSFWITWDGRMTPCGMMNILETRPFEDGFDKCWDYIVKGIDKIFLPKECSNCKNRKACTVCGALVLAEGNSRIKPEYLCGITQEYVDRCIDFLEKKSL